MDGSLLTLPRVYWIVSLGSDLAVVGLLVRALALGRRPKEYRAVDCGGHAGCVGRAFTRAR